MNKALALAKKGQGKTHPNPCVGAIVVKNKKIIGQGFHEKSGQEHAEILALEQSGIKSRKSELYVTLEPCAHEGKTPPCVDSIIKSGISRIIIGTKDPNPLVNGKSILKLKNAGIKVELGVMAEQCKLINQGFFKRMSKQQPFIRSKVACSFDGKISLKNHESKWISCESSRLDVQYWRSISSAIMTGVSTINHDDPHLNVRLPNNNSQPCRIILDTHLSINLKAQILKQSNIIIFHYDDPRSIKKKLEKMGVLLIRTKVKKNKIDLNDLITKLYDLELNDILVEAGPTLNGELLKAKLIDEMIIYQAPILMAGEAFSIFDGPVLKKMSERIHLEHTDIRNFDKDIRYLTKIHYPNVD